MLERFKRAMALMQASWSVLRQDRELILLPILAALSSLALVALLVFGVLWDDIRAAADGGALPQYGPGMWVLSGIVGYVLSFVAIFFNVAIICAADERMRGGDPTLGSAMRAAAGHARAIAPWALVSVIIQSVIRAIEERGGVVGKIAGTVLGVGWALVTYLILPVLVFEGVGVREALTRSKDLFKRTWGETVSGELGLSLVGFLAVLVALPFLLVVGGGGQPQMVALAVGLGIVWLVIVGAVLSALSAVFRLALYRYATEGETPAEFDGVDFAELFPAKRKRLFG